MIAKLLVLAFLLASIGVVVLAIAGSIRYGSLEDFVLRVRAEIAARRPHPALVPTPIAYDAQGATATRWPAPSLPMPTRPVATTRPVETTRSVATTQPVAGATQTAVVPPKSTPSCTSVSPEKPSTPSPTGTATPTLTPVPIHQPARASVELIGLTHMWQTWNNCGPATLAMHLSYFGIQLGQADVAAGMRPNREDKNVGPEELAAFARTQGLEALVRVNGDADRLGLFLSNGLPVMIRSWVEEEPGEGLGHYRLLTGYDDARQEWIAYDSFISVGVDPDQPYQGIRLLYEQTEQWWAVFNHTYVVIYRAEMEPLVRSILGSDFDDAAMWQRALESADKKVRQRPEDPFAWFNLGTDLVAAQAFERAAGAYDQARTIGLPWRMLWYQFGPFEAYYCTGRYKELIALARATLDVTEYVEEVHYWLGMGLQAAGDGDGAVRAFRRALTLNPDYAQAAEALAALGE
ncbi:MAG: C39 family peptidase [Anaerolineae bacterium]|nr:C39 family peptidase [Anaerolineae bacterium]